MPITATRTKTTLTASDFVGVASLTDPNDPTAVIDALTNFNFRLVPFIGPVLDPSIVDAFTRRVGTDLMLREDLSLEISPNCSRLTTVTMTAALLLHEQFHYDCALVVARVVAKELSRIKAPNQAGLQAEKTRVDQFHFVTRNKLIQNRYDLDSRHGLNLHYQTIWKTRMTTCLGNANATQIGGFWL